MTEWRDIAGWEGYYQVSSQGEILSLSRLIHPKDGRKPLIKPARLLRPMWSGRDGAKYGKVRLCRGGEYEDRAVAAIVCEAFNGPRPNGYVCRHLDGDPSNNTAANLAWGTPSQNALDSVQHGTHVSARRTHCPQGHEYSPENTYYTANMRRLCRTCRLSKSQEWRTANPGYDSPSHKTRDRRTPAGGLKGPS